MLKTIAFDNPTASLVRLQPARNRVCASVKTRETRLCHAGNEVAQTIVAQLGPSSNLPDAVSHPLSDSRPSPIPEPLPQSLRSILRSRRSACETATAGLSTIDERVGAHQVVGDRIWFGKAFYDGEGTTGVGGLVISMPVKTVHNIFDSRTRGLVDIRAVCGK